METIEELREKRDSLSEIRNNMIENNGNPYEINLIGEDMRTLNCRISDLQEKTLRWDKQEYDTEGLTDTFKVLGFYYGYCVVEHKETGQKGSFDFKATEFGRVYFNYKGA